MKKTIRLMSFVLILLVLTSIFPLAGFAYGTDDSKLIVTHLNTSSPEGAGVILTPLTGTTVGSGFDWWVLVTFDWSEADSCYKVTNVQPEMNVNKSSTVIPETGFVYAVNTGNNYPYLYNQDPVKYAVHKNKPNYRTTRTDNSFNYAKALTVGTKAYLYNTDITNLVVLDNGHNWYAEDYVSESYIKIGTPDSTGVLYDPNNVEKLIKQYTLEPTDINSDVYTKGKSVLFTKSYGTNIYGNGTAPKYQWWKTVVFDWNDVDDCYVITSINTTMDNNSAKQPVIPENGFVLAVCTDTADANDPTAVTYSNISKLELGSKAYLYDINIAAGTLGTSPKICVNKPDGDLTAYTPTLAGTRLQAPVLTNMTEKRTLTSNTNFEVKWSAVEGATGYVINVNNSTYVTDGVLTVSNASVTGTSYTISGSLLEIGNTYTVSVYATGTGKAPSMISRARLAVISEDALNSSLRTKTIVAFGDSLTAKSGWVGLLGGRFGAEVINAGVGGDSTFNARSRFANHVVAREPDIVLINFGMNDQSMGITTKKPIIALDIYTENLEYFATELTESGVDVVFVTPNPVCTAEGYYSPGGYGLNYGTDNMLRYCEAMRKVALKYGCGLVDINAECGKEDLTKFLNAGDGIHQSAYGHQRYAELIGDYLVAAYDDNNASTVEIRYLDDKDALLADSVTLKGAIGSTVLIPCADIDGYVSATKSKSFTFTSSAQTVTFMYSEADKTIELDGQSGFTISEDFLFINSAKLSVADVLAQIKTAGVTCTPKSGSFVGTGSVLQLKSGDTVIDELTVILKGDASGDGDITAKDYLYVKRSFLGTLNLNDDALAAGDIDGNGSITSMDYLKLKRHVIGTYDIFG